MQRLSHLAVEIDARQAQQTVTQLDWPSGPAASLDNTKQRLLWLPFDAHSGVSLLDGRQAPRLAQLALPTITAGKIIEGPPPGPYPKVRGDASDVLFAPFFLFNGAEPDNIWAAVDGLDGRVAGGRLKAKGSAAVARLVLLVFLAVFVFYAATVYVNLAVTMVFSLLGPMLRLAHGLLQVVSGGLMLALFFLLLRWMMGQREKLFNCLSEPVARVESGVIDLPLDRRWLALLRGLSTVSLILVPFIVLSLLIPMPGSGVATVPFRLLQLLFALLLGISARRLSRGDWLKQAPARDDRQSAQAPALLSAKTGNTTDLVGVVLNVALFAMFGTVVGHVLDLFDLGGLLQQEFEIDTGLFAGFGAAIGAVFGVVISGISGPARITLAVGLSSGLMTDVVFSPWVGVPVLFALVAITSWLTASRPSSASPAEPRYWRALRTAWAFVFGGIIGSIAGSVVGFVLMGPIGLVAGAFLGDQILATAALMSQQASGSSGRQRGGG